MVASEPITTVVTESVVLGVNEIKNELGETDIESDNSHLLNMSIVIFNVIVVADLVVFMLLDLFV